MAAHLQSAGLHGCSADGLQCHKPAVLHVCKDATLRGCDLADLVVDFWVDFLVDLVVDCW